MIHGNEQNDLGPKYVSVVVNDQHNQPVRHALRVPPAASEQYVREAPLELACDNDVTIWGHRRQVVGPWDLTCHICRKLVGL